MKNEEELRKSLQSVNEKYQGVRSFQKRLQVKIRFAEQYGTIMGLLVDNLITDGRLTKDEVKAFFGTFPYRDKKQIAATLNQRPHYKAWRVKKK